MPLPAFRSSFGLLAILFAVACGSSSGSEDTTPTKENSVKPADSAKAEAPKSKPGLEAPDNDPALVALMKEVLVCYRKPDCAAQGKWYEPFHKDQQVDFKTLVNFIEDEKPEVRTLAAGVLRGKKGKPGFHTDTAYAKRVLDALEKDTDDDAAREIALAAGFIDVKATGLESRMVNIIQLDPREKVRTSMIETILYNNADAPAMVAAVKQLILDPNTNIRVAVVRAFDAEGVKKDGCSVWAGNLDHEDRYLADKCYYYLVANPCSSHYDAMLDAAEKRPPTAIENFQALCMQGGTPSNIKERLIKATDAWANNTKLLGMQRAESLKVLAACDPARAKKVAGALTKDKEEYVREKAIELDKSLPKP